jgi:hypothetical protein
MGGAFEDLLPMPSKKSNEPVEDLPPHPATVAQPKRPFGGGIAARPPHCATVLQGKAAPRKGAGKVLAPHPATVAQPKRPFGGGIAARPPHPATMVQPGVLQRRLVEKAEAVARRVVQRMDRIPGIVIRSESDPNPELYIGAGQTKNKTMEKWWVMVLDEEQFDDQYNIWSKLGETWNSHGKFCASLVAEWLKNGDKFKLLGTDFCFQTLSPEVKEKLVRLNMQWELGESAYSEQEKWLQEEFGGNVTKSWSDILKMIEATDQWVGLNVFIGTPVHALGLFFLDDESCIFYDPDQKGFELINREDDGEELGRRIKDFKFARYFK